MGDFSVTFASQGGHGCERKAKAGEQFYGCGRLDCPDCYAAELVQQFHARFPVHFATFTHWPVSLNEKMGRNYQPESEVVDSIVETVNYTGRQPLVVPNLRKRIKGRFNPS
jgi:hypothetical protein